MRPEGGTVDINEFCRRLGRAVRDYRRAARLTQEQLAERAAASPEWISQVERGLGAPSLELLLKLASALSVSPADLVAAAHAADERPVLQELHLTAGRLADGEIRVLLATAHALAEERPTGREPEG